MSFTIKPLTTSSKVTATKLFKPDEMVLLTIRAVNFLIDSNLKLMRVYYTSRQLKINKLKIDQVDQVECRVSQKQTGEIT